MLQLQQCASQQDLKICWLEERSLMGWQRVLQLYGMCWQVESITGSVLLLSVKTFEEWWSREALGTFAVPIYVF